MEYLDRSAKENGLRENEAFADALDGCAGLLDGMPCGLAVLSCTPEHVHPVYLSAGFFALTGHSREEYTALMQKDAGALIFAGDLPRVKQLFAELAAHDTPVECVYRAYAKDGSFRWLRCRAAVTARQGEAFTFSAAFFDVTRQRATDETLRIRENEYRLAIANSGKLVYRYNVSQRSIDISPEAAALFGHPAHLGHVPESLIDKGTVAPESVDTLIDFYRRIDSGEPTGSMTACRRIRDGRYRWFEARFSTIFNDAHEPVSAIILFVDVTEERAEHIVSELDRIRLITALSAAYPVSLSVNLTKGTYKVISGGEHLLLPEGGAGAIDDIIRESAQRMPKAYAEQLTARFSAAALLNALSGDTESTWMEFRQLSRDGRTHWVELLALRVPNGYDSDVAGVVLLRWIDEQKATEEKLAQALEQTSGTLSAAREYQRILDDSIPVGTVIFKLDKPGTLLHVGGTLLSELGYTREEFEAFQRKHLRGFVLDEDYGTAFQDMRISLTAPAAGCEQEFRVRKKDGSIAWLYEKGTLVQFSDGSRGYVCVHINNTRRKEMEERLRVSEEETRLAMSQMGKMLCVYDVATRTLTLPEAYANKHGLPLTVSNMPECIGTWGILDSEGREACSAFYHAILNGEPTGVRESRYVAPDGAQCWERSEFVTIFGLDGKPVKAIVAVEDVTQQHAREDENEALRENARVFRTVAAHSNRRIYRYDIAARTLYAAASMDDATHAFTLGYDGPLSEENGRILPESLDDYRAALHAVETGAAEGSAKLHIRLPDGASHWLDMRYSVIEAADGGKRTAVLSFGDITSEHERELAYERYKQAVSDDAQREGIVYFEADLTSDIVEKQGGNLPTLSFPISGCRHDETVGYGIQTYIDADERARAWAFFSREHLITAFSDGFRSLSADWPVTLSGGRAYWFHADVQMILDPYSDHIKSYTILHDVTEEKRAALDVKRQAETDGMTGLYNKATVEALVKRRLAEGSGEPCALIIVDLDSLKSINDNLGHAQGDRAIKSIAAALQAEFRRTDIIGRIGGDEFLVFLEGMRSESRIHSIMNAFMHRLTDLRLGEHDEMPLHGSIGAAMGVMGADAFETLYRRADIALYHVKRNGKNDYAFYTPDMEQTAHGEHADPASVKPE